MKVLAFGEVLFDCYPTAKKIGGAPLNFCAHLKQLGANSFLYSAVGADAEGEQALQIAKGLGVDTRYFSVANQLPTGVCRVTYQDGEPCYDLSLRCAYDAILLTDMEEETFDLFYFGTLAQRDPVSRDTLQKLLSSGRFSSVFFDINLRQHYYSEELVKEGLFACNIVKMNREEFSYVKEISHIKESSDEKALQAICDCYHIQTALLTLDKDGACALDETQGFVRATAKESEFCSAVGAGDSFSACFLYHLFCGASLSTALEQASILAAYVVSREEAIPVYPQELKQKLQPIT